MPSRFESGIVAAEPPRLRRVEFDVAYCWGSAFGGRPRFAQDDGYGEGPSID